MNTSNKHRWDLDEIDKLIFEQGLRIKAVYFHSEMDLMFFLLSNKRILQRQISEFKLLAKAEGLENYEISRTGIHWPDLDEDISLRGLLQKEMLAMIKVPAIAA